MAQKAVKFWKGAIHLSLDTALAQNALRRPHFLSVLLPSVCSSTPAACAICVTTSNREKQAKALDAPEQADN